MMRDDSLTPIYAAVIFNKNSFLGTISNKNGNFKMRVKVGDTLQITHIGFVTSLVIFDRLDFDVNEKIRINMESRSYELPAIEVRRYRIRDKNNQKPFSLRRTDNIVYNMGTLQLENAGPYYYNPNSAGIPGAMPSYGLFIPDFKQIKRQQQLDKIASLEKKDLVKKYVKYKYSKALVNKLTGLTGNELENFMNYCKPTEKMVIDASEYELTYFVLDCYEKFNQENE
ncbi:MAG: hypothetical protein ACKVOU_14335 [Cytophagales bacterium]